MNTHILPAISCFAIALFFFSCKAQKFTPADYPDKQLRFGSGGGFTGETKAFVLLDNGQLFSHDIKEDSFTRLNKVGRKVCKSLFAEADSLGLVSKAYDHPGNMYYFVEIAAEEGKNRITWGGDGPALEGAYPALYKTLMKLTKE